MNADIKARWQQALRSGDYRQGVSRLRRRADGGDRFCCLGVLCELAVEAGVIEAPVESEIGYRYGATGDLLGDAVYLPPAVAKWAGLSTNPAVEHVVGHEAGGRMTRWSTLAKLNDSKTPFSTIADLIEQL